MQTNVQWWILSDYGPLPISPMLAATWSALIPGRLFLGRPQFAILFSQHDAHSKTPHRQSPIALCVAVATPAESTAEWFLFDSIRPLCNLQSRRASATHPSGAESRQPQTEPDPQSAYLCEPGPYGMPRIRKPKPARNEYPHGHAPPLFP